MLGMLLTARGNARPSDDNLRTFQSLRASGSLTILEISTKIVHHRRKVRISSKR
jgi:hypothetical protein